MQRDAMVRGPGSRVGMAEDDRCGSDLAASQALAALLSLRLGAAFLAKGEEVELIGQVQEGE